MIRQIKIFCEENEIVLELLQKRVNFVKLYDLSGNNSKEELFQRCRRKFMIIAMRENELAVCYAPFALPYAEIKFNIGYRKDRINARTKNGFKEYHYLASSSIASIISLSYNTFRTARITGISVSRFLPILLRIRFMLL